MNVQPKRSPLIPETVTTGPLTGSRKVYYSPASHPELRVPGSPTQRVGGQRQHGGQNAKNRVVHGGKRRGARSQVSVIKGTWG